MNKKGKTELITILALVVMGIFIAEAFGAINLFAGIGPDGSNEVIQDKVAASTSLTVGPVQDMYNPTTSMSGEYHDLIKGEYVLARYADSATETSVAPGDKISGYYAINSTVYYAIPIEAFVIPDTGAMSTADMGEREICKQVALTYQSFDDNDQPITTVIDDHNITVANGDNVDVRLRLEGTKDYCFSPQKSGILVIEYLDNQTDKVEVSLNGVDLSKATTPSQFVLTSVAYETSAFEIPSFMSNMKKTFDVYIDTDDTNGGDAQLIKAQVFDADYVRDSDSGDYVLAYEDVSLSNADVGVSTSKTNIFQLE